MSTNDDNVRLVAMGVYATKAIKILGTTGQDELEQNEMMQFALIKLVEIVGEAANCVSEQTRSRYGTIPWADVIGMRHRLVHDYEAIDLGMVRATIVDDLPALIENLRAIVGEGVADLAFPRTGP